MTTPATPATPTEILAMNARVLRALHAAAEFLLDGDIMPAISALEQGRGEPASRAWPTREALKALLHRFLDHHRERARQVGADACACPLCHDTRCTLDGHVV